jgi:hypothetical protein
MGVAWFLAVVGLTGFYWGLDVAIVLGILAWLVWVVWGDYRAWRRRQAIE